MAVIPFVYRYDFEYAELEQITPLIRRVTARNPSGFTFHGTGTYVIGKGNVAVGLMVMGLFIGISIALGLVIGIGLG